ncbi:MAG TPA: glucoamylase family protein [Geobacteraceae bacterium]|nr:glucoamylase family protein [Geobacteraceae bacterium]
MSASILAGYFVNNNEARGALRELRRKGFCRAALIRRTVNGDVRMSDHFPWRRALRATLAAILFGGLAGVASLLFHLPGGSLSILTIAGGSTGILACLAWIRRSRYGIEPGLMQDHARWLMPGETVLILQASIDTLQIPMAVLRESSDIPPAVFVMHPKRERRNEVRGSSVMLSPPQVREHALRIAGDHQVDPKPSRDNALLKRLEQARLWVRQACSDLSAATRLEQSATPAAEWILDNEYIIEESVRDVLLNLPKRFYRKLPMLSAAPYRGLPRIYGLAKELVSHTEMRLERENILVFIEAYQTMHTLTIGELWAVPQMLRIALNESIQNLATTAMTDLRERQLADFWANRLIAANRRDPNQLFSILAELAVAEPSPSPYFGAQLVGHLYDEAAALAPVQSWLERTLRKSMNDLNLREQNRRTMEQIASSNAFTSLRQLELLDWRDVFEQLSRVEKVLRLDPSGVYPEMDFDTRDRCRRTIEELARRSGQSEEQLARRAIGMAAQSLQDSAEDERLYHVGTWLIGEKRCEFARLTECREAPGFRVLQWVYRHYAAVYFLGIGTLAALFISLIIGFAMTGQAPGIRLFATLLLLVPVSQLSIEVINYFVTRLLPARTLPKMDFKDSGIPDAFRTLVVVPMMLADAGTVRSEVEKLEIRYLANKEANLLFGLFTDYTDSHQLRHEDDAQLLRSAIEFIEDLNQRHGSERFFLFHRERTWSESEQKFIGWERKRGKLEELNDLIVGTRPEAAPRLVYVGDPEHLADVRFVITLDSDTQLPHGTARRMIETLAHPLNRPRFDADGRIAAGSYTIIQPRVSPTLTSTSASTFSRLFADAVGIDPYTQAVSDVHQDLCGEGSYHGKGIYDVRAFSRVLSGRFPEEWVLSHDLIEGSHVRVGLASDIELYDEFPQGYQSYAKRAHRWIRGDWQIAGWVFPRVPLAAGGRGANPLSLFDRWKIFDNLRRSLIPAAGLGLLTASWLISPRAGVAASLVVAMQLLFHPLAQPFTMATTRKGLRHFSMAKVKHDLLRAITDAALLPHQAAVALDAIARVWYRRLVSRRGLLEWTAQATHWSASRRQPLFVATLALGSIFSALLGWAIFRHMPSSLAIAGPWLLLWFFSPLLGWLLNLRPHVKSRQYPLPAQDVRFLRNIARRTWRYFSEFVGDETSWLPPDNYQVSHQNQLAMRTSPTNIGLWMTSVLGAYDSGYLTVNQAVEKLTLTMETIGRLERYRGHLLNWYDIRTLAPLEPRYVSCVDSGNLLGALWALEQGLEELLRAPVLDGKAFAGMADTGEILKQVAGRERLAGFDPRILDELLHDWEAPSDRVVDSLRLLRRVEGSFRVPLVLAKESSWAGEMESQVSALLSIADRYLSWIEILVEKPEEEIARLGPEALNAIREDLARAPSLSELAAGRAVSIPILKSILGESAEAPGPLAEWIARVLEAFARSQWLAGETLGMGERLISAVRELSAAIDMGFLYDPERKLFSIGYNVSGDRLDSSFYDLLASEARLGSFAAIARGDVPLEHWFSMNRPYGAVGRDRVLLSWAGTMFEYLMPLLFQRSYGNSLLDKAAGEAVAVQIDYGRKSRVPWGISESAYADLDINKTYQYKAFGVPALGLKRGLDEQLVVAPYATLLALNVAPDEAVRNLNRLAGLGLLGDYGYYEAMDFSRQQHRDGGRGVVIEAYMAHHQGMGFLALTNFLHDSPFPRRFHADARVRAFESLLQERIPNLPPLHLISTRENAPMLMSPETVAPAATTFTTPHTSTPRSLLLCNGRYGLMVTNSGGGYSQWGDREITRWRSDRTRDSWGTFCYIHEADSDSLWSTTWHPVGGKVESYSVDFALDRAVFRRVDKGLHSETEVIVSQEDDVEIRRITLDNRSGRVRRLDLTSYIELSMAPHNADRQHPAFSKLFVQTEAVPEQRAILACRRPRGENDPSMYVGHRFTSENAGHEAFEFETDRGRFIGRGRTLVDPMGALQSLGNSQGFVLDPILSLRHSLTLEPGRQVRISLVLAAGETREQVLRLMDKFSEPHVIERTMDFAWGLAQQELQVLHMLPEEARRFQQLASHLLFPNPLLRPPAERLAENRKGQAGLWPYGISGDVPIAMVTIKEARDIGLVSQMLRAHTYWRLHGLTADLVILNEEAGGYEQPLREQLERLVRTRSMHAATNRPGGIFLRSAAQIPEEDLRLFKASASIVLVAARGTLPQQLGMPIEIPDLAEPLARKHAFRDPSVPLPFMELNYFNSLGGFTPDSREYAIYLGPDTHTPAPWVNVIANPTFGTLVTETGSGFTWYGNSQRNRLTQWSNDPVMDPSSEAVYIRDEESGAFWTPTPAPIREEIAYRARHGAGYTVFEHNSHGIEQELTVFVPVDENGGEPVKLQRLRLKNDTSRRRRISVTYYVELTLGEHRESSQMHVITHWDDEAKALLARNRFHPEYGERITFVSMCPSADSHGGDRTSFIGRNRSPANPAAMEQTRLSRRTGAGLDPCAALRVTLELAPGERGEITCMLGQAESVEQARGLVLAYREDAATANALARTKAWWDALLGNIEVHTPEPSADLLVNRWLQYQSLSCRIWGRSGFYQSGGAFGFRDQLQDVMSFLSTNPDLARKQILLAAGRQFKEGDVQHWWHEPSGAGIRSRISDDLLWLPYVVAHYVRATGDSGILEAEIPFLDAPTLADDQQEIFSTPEVTFERATLFEHCRRAVARGLTTGPHGLPLIGTGDWNDGMNLVGAGGKGESVWLAWFLADLLQGMVELSNLLQQLELSRSYQEERNALLRRVEQAGWDGEWYLRGTFDDGTPLGSAANMEAKIDSLPQSWAWLSGAADPERAEKALESAWRRLVREDEGLVLLFEPPFDKTEPSPGYIKGYPPGVRENGGQYTHAALWMAMALARKGDGERAVKMLRMLNPIEHARDPESVWNYGVEPYVIAADVYRLTGRVGRGGWSWYTGSAAWMYRAWVEEILGLQIRGEQMLVNPVIPAAWEGFSIRYRHGETIYEIRVENPHGSERGVAWVEMDGQHIRDGVIPLERGLIKHQVLVRMGDPV